MARFLLAGLAALAVCATPALAQDPDCPFTSGSCPVTLDNVVDVYFHDIIDDFSCQIECQTIEDCNYFTMFGVNDDPVDHKKCFLFKECDTMEPCEECTTGPAYPPIDDCLGGSYSCETDLDNIVDLYYYDDADGFSCPNSCYLLDECNFYTEYIYVDEDTGTEKMKCYLFKNCNIHETCSTCTTGTKPVGLE